MKKQILAAYETFWLTVEKAYATGDPNAGLADVASDAQLIRLSESVIKRAGQGQFSKGHVTVVSASVDSIEPSAHAAVVLSCTSSANWRIYSTKTGKPIAPAPTVGLLTRYSMKLIDGKWMVSNSVRQAEC